MILRIPVLPAICRNGVITFNTVTLTLMTNINGELKNYSDPNLSDTLLLRAEPGEPINIYIDESKQPKFSRYAGGRGWQSPPADYVKQCEEAGIDYGTLTMIDCKCQRGELSREDIASLEECGHSLACEHFQRPDAPAKQIKESVSKPSSPPDPNVDRSLVEAIEAGQAPTEAKKPEKSDFCPEGGIPVNSVLPNLVAYMEGTSSNEMGLDAALDAIGWKEPVNHSIVIKELAKFQNFTICNGCSNWATVSNLGNPRCVGCSPPV